MKQFKLCAGGCGRYGAYKNSLCDSCRSKEEARRLIAKKQKEKFSKIKKGGQKAWN